MQTIQLVKLLACFFPTTRIVDSYLTLQQNQSEGDRKLLVMNYMLYMYMTNGNWPKRVCHFEASQFNLCQIVRGWLRSFVTYTEGVGSEY